MKKQYFRFKIKNEFLPGFVLNYFGKVQKEFVDVYSIDNIYLRKLKLQKIENTISDEDRTFLDYLIDDRFTYFMTKKEYEKLLNSRAMMSGMSGSSGSYVVSGSTF